MSSGGGSAPNLTPGVSWTHPFGAGSAVDRYANAQDVSTRRPFGGSAFGNAVSGVDNPKLKANGSEAGQSSNTPVEVTPTAPIDKTNGIEFGSPIVRRPGPGTDTTITTPNNPDTSVQPNALGMRAPMRNTSGEDSFRNSYLSSLKPNTAFTFNAQNPAIFGVNTSLGAKK